jgi:hypothetical protein
MNKPIPEQTHDGMDLRGTLFIVFTIALIIAVVWFAVYLIFISRS